MGELKLLFKSNDDILQTLNGYFIDVILKKGLIDCESIVEDLIACIHISPEITNAVLRSFSAMLLLKEDGIIEAVGKAIPWLTDLLGEEEICDAAKSTLIAYLVCLHSGLSLEKCREVLITGFMHEIKNVAQRISSCFSEAIESLRKDENSAATARKNILECALKEASQFIQEREKNEEDHAPGASGEESGQNQNKASKVKKSWEKRLKETLHTFRKSLQVPTSHNVKKDIALINGYLNQREREKQTSEENLKWLQALCRVISKKGPDFSKINHEPLIKVLKTLSLEKNNCQDVIKQALVATALLAHNRRDFFLQNLEDLLHLIFENLLSVHLSNYAYAALDFIVEEIQSKRLLLCLNYHRKKCYNSASLGHERKFIKLIEKLVRTWKVDELNFHLAAVQAIISNGIKDADSETRRHWRRLYWTFHQKFAKQGSVVVLQMAEACLNEVVMIKARASNESTTATNEPIIVGINSAEGLNGESPDDSILRSGGIIKLNHTQPLIQDLKPMMKNARESEVLKGKMGVNIVSLRVIPHKKLIRLNKEKTLHEEFKDVSNFVQMITIIPLFSGDAIVTEHFKYNLREYFERKDSRFPDDDLNRIAHQIVVGITRLHAKNIVHGDLTPEHIFIVRHSDRTVAKIGNFRRSSGGISGPSLYSPSDEWCVPETKEGSLKLSCASDIYSLGMICCYTWYKGTKHLTNTIDIDTFLKKFNVKNLNVSRFLRLTHCTKESSRFKASQLMLHPVFWKKGSILFFLERLQIWLRRRNFKIRPNQSDKDISNWKPLMPKELLEEMEKFLKEKYNAEPYSSHLNGLVDCLRNLIVHKNTIQNAKDIQNLNEWIQKTFSEQLHLIYKICFRNLGMSFSMEFQGHLVTPLI